ncbi:N-acetylmuramoyl-L-alanine amidase [Pseudoclavibacter sp. CFCC 11306]|uniref:N-acetylmuramoyl-L-alanine amidase n=1 Tax=Pseudoclavibacter sp. CFCC 11306 TaxID=1564493 RepID=UPI0013012C98|nr:peptidoglycan recognition family protein [Pseudoclavibacter sp. CFCC 11306]KAB1659024.1 N-acetylmuramoyl-L-alanine amidase [Pseudoclavibacter sp. CFCC 11306]
MDYIQAGGMGALLNNGRPSLLVIHSMENPLQVGRARGIAKYFAGINTASAHYCVGPDEVIQCVPTNRKAWHAGPNANAFTLGYEQTGYAAYSRSDWLTATGRAQLANLASVCRADAARYGIPIRWATDEQIRAARYGTPAGFCTHADISRVLGGTNHWDPGNNYPRDLLMQAMNGQQIGDDMPSVTDIWDWKIGQNGIYGKDNMPAWQVLGYTHADGLWTQGLVKALPGTILGTSIKDADGINGTVGDRLAWIDKRARDTEAKVDQVAAAVTALGQTIEAMNTGQIAEQVKAQITDALKGLSITLTTKENA